MHRYTCDTQTIRDNLEHVNWNNRKKVRLKNNGNYLRTSIRSNNYIEPINDKGKEYELTGNLLVYNKNEGEGESPAIIYDQDW